MTPCRRVRWRIAILAGVAGALLVPGTAFAEADPSGAARIGANPTLALNFASTLIAASLPARPDTRRSCRYHWARP